jgi:hypothetical protein
MKKERMDILKELYDYAIEEGSFNLPYNMSFNEMLHHGIDLEYLELAEYLKIAKDGHPDKGWDVNLTIKGIDLVEDEIRLEQTDIFEFAERYGTYTKLIEDRIREGIDKV